MGLITGLLTRPPRPQRGTAWLAERIQEQAEGALRDESSIRAALFELDEARQAGELTPEEIDTAEDLLIERLVEVRGAELKETGHRRPSWLVHGYPGED